MLSLTKLVQGVCPFIGSRTRQRLPFGHGLPAEAVGPVQGFANERHMQGLHTAMGQADCSVSVCGPETDMTTAASLFHAFLVMSAVQENIS